jgi:predicted PurR-regulated permease PerM
MSDGPGERSAPAGDREAARTVLRAGPRWAVIGIFLLLAIQALAYARAFMLPVVLGLFLALVFSPMRRFLERLGVPSGIAATAIVGALLAGVVGAVLSLAVPVSTWVERAPIIGLQIEGKIRELQDAAEGVREAAEQVDRLAEAGAEEDADVQRVVVEEPGGAVEIAMQMPAALAQIMFTLILLFFLLSSGDMFLEKVVHVMPSFPDKRRAVLIARDIERKLSRYLFTITVINAGLGISIGLAMWLLGMPNPLLFGMLGFLLNYIPYVGAVLGVVFAVVVGLLSLDEISQAALAGAVYFTLTSIEGQFVTPYFVGRSLRLNTVVVFLSVTFWAWLWSVVGMLVATPLLVMTRTLCDHIEPLAPLGKFLSARGAEREEAEEETAR